MGFSLFLKVILIALFVFSITKTSGQLCSTASCGGLSIDFPFRLSDQRILCGYPGFDLSCNNRSQAILSLPSAGDFAVTKIDLEDQRVWITDPDGCLPRRFLANFTPDGSAFQLADSYSLVNYSFLNCPSNFTTSFYLPSISCLRSPNATNRSVYAVMANPQFSMTWTSSCQLISHAMVPVPSESFWTDYDADIELQWDNPNCGYCESQGGRCGFAFGDSGPYVACYGYDAPTESQDGLSRRAKIGVALGLGIPGFLGAVILACIFWGKMKTQEERRRQVSTEFSTAIIPHPTVIVMGLDGATIEKYPKTQLGESGRLPNPNDNVCAICLSEYKPKDTLRTIPDCNHYFHATCIDGWLKMNATCPLCRKLPSPPSLATSNSNSLPLPAPPDSS